VAAVDGGQWRRRRSGEGLSSGGKVAVEKKSLRVLSRSGSSYWVCLKARRSVARASRSWRRRRHAWRRGQRRCDVEGVGACQRGVGKAAGGRGRMRGSAGSRRWRRSGCSDGERRRRAARADGRAAWHGEERLARVGETVALG
jgi:hypothetical protein